MLNVGEPLKFIEPSAASSRLDNIGYDISPANEPFRESSCLR
jgi:hypothetical protein